MAVKVDVLVAHLVFHWSEWGFFEVKSQEESQEEFFEILAEMSTWTPG